MEQLWKSVALCLAGAVFVAVLKKKTPELAMMVTIAVIGVIGTALVHTIGDVLELVTRFVHLGNLPEQLFRPLIKTVGIALVTRLGSDICRDAGEGAMASVLEISGALGAVVVSLPLFEAVWDMLQSLL